MPANLLEGDSKSTFHEKHLRTAACTYSKTAGILESFLRGPFSEMSTCEFYQDQDLDARCQFVKSLAVLNREFVFVVAS